MIALARSRRSNAAHNYRSSSAADGPMIMLPQEPTFSDITQAGSEIVTRGEPHPICDGFFFGSGAIARVTDYETGLAGHHSFRGEVGSPDPLPDSRSRGYRGRCLRKS